VIRAGIPLKINVGAADVCEARRTEQHEKNNYDAAIHVALTPNAREPVAESKPHARGEDRCN